MPGPDDELYPLVFTPLLKEVVWGGRRLVADLGKAGDPSACLGESWELVDLPDDQSVVCHGQLAGTALHALVEERGDELLGPVATEGGRFPLLVKTIDAARTLSVQVHPDREVAQRLGGRPKSEAWLILAVEPGAKLYLGLKPGVGSADVERAVAERNFERLLIEVEPQVGDLVPVRPGTVHAIGGGILLAEVQQPSDTTYRLYDWGRVGLDGKPRQLHIAESLASIDYEARPTIGPSVYDAGCFRAEVHRFSRGEEQPFDGEGPLVVVGLVGRARVSGGKGPAQSVARGGAVLVPHVCRPAFLRGEEAGSALVVSFPKRETRFRASF